jgi:glutamyl-Q tRNA(Asp) synthetase
MSVLSASRAPYIGRFAPSPTGPLHFGSLVAAVASYLDARAHGGQWRLRIEDVDETRCQPQFTDDILRSLYAFGLRWDGEVMMQTRRKADYQTALQRLDQQSATYACICSRREIADSAIAGLDGPVYPGTCRSARHDPAGPAIRVITDNQPIRFMDRLQGVVSQRLGSQLGDFIVRRRDGLFAYQLAVVVDDAEQGITQVVRGADLIDSTPRQIHLQRLLGVATPQYLHVPVATNAHGQKLSKQTLAPALGNTDACRLLLRALQFLGQPPIAAAAGASLPALLAVAQRNWQVAAIPARRQLALVD